MPGQLTNLIDVVIVLIALYILLSTICSFINEQIATFLKLRGKKLYLGVGIWSRRNRSQMRSLRIRRSIRA